MPSLVSGAYPNEQTGLYSDTNAFDVVIEPVLVVNDKQLLLIDIYHTSSHQDLSTDDTQVNAIHTNGIAVSVPKELSSLLLSDRSSVLCPYSQLFSIVEPYLIEERSGGMVDWVREGRVLYPVVNVCALGYILVFIPSCKTQKC
ncbi:hypothetical protein K435DRAFT_799858 [Dendrothele bispora CBS 962.96]|uniref:Uncharacterized protein n=1 Tax=Dendrothele bispora (strain CBS 962.96) TaxID=1314807 RepID=A0A4S8LW36_DENBC|nr:hypothetical protein K435DRAFT_799858 [Dendrothele bispora CBS 962.96]